jgi:hypothetical protein
LRWLDLRVRKSYAELTEAATICASCPVWAEPPDRCGKAYSMTARQRFAIEHPCFTGEDCAGWENRWVRPPWSAILTLNIGLDDGPIFDGLPLWHCSVALLSASGGAVPLVLWDDDAIKQCERFIRDRLLAGVGDAAREDTEIGECAIHVRRCCSERELEALKRKRVWPRPQDRARWN